jgi:hypothetical protein
MKKSLTQYWSSPALQLEPRLSPALCWLAITLLAVTVACILVSALPLWMGLSLSVLAGLAVLGELKQLNRHSYLFEHGQWFVHFKAGTRVALQPASGPLLSEHVMAVLFREQAAPGRVYQVFLLPDMVDVESWRRTSLALRQGTDSG